MLKFKNLVHFPLKRLFCTASTSVLEPLTSRTLIRMSGPEVPNFLQGLITNDITHLHSGPGSMYTMFLNSAGRVLYDAIVYRNLDDNTYLIECDNRITDNLQKHLKLYKIRRKIDITSLSDEFKVYVLFNSGSAPAPGKETVILGDAIVPRQKLSESPTFRSCNDLLIYRDPRISDLGSRIIAKSDKNIAEILGVITQTQPDSERNYRWLRYSLGVGEGVDDLPPGECFPLECNCDYLHGVSFHKGCYIGQELTARVHHTGVVRKRLMPIHFTKVPSKLPDQKIVQENVNLGKFKGIEKNAGLALLRIEKALAFSELKLGDGIGLTHKPDWWPSELPKEKITKINS